MLETDSTIVDGRVWSGVDPKAAVTTCAAGLVGEQIRRRWMWAIGESRIELVGYWVGVAGVNDRAGGSTEGIGRRSRWLWSRRTPDVLDEVARR